MRELSSTIETRQQQIDGLQRSNIYRSEQEYEVLRNCVYIYLYVMKAVSRLTRAEAEGGGDAIQMPAMVSN